MPYPGDHPPADLHHPPTERVRPPLTVVRPQFVGVEREPGQQRRAHVTDGAGQREHAVPVEVLVQHRVEYQRGEAQADRVDEGAERGGDRVRGDQPPLLDHVWLRGGQSGEQEPVDPDDQ